MDKEGVIHTHTHTMEYYSAIKKNAITSYAATRMQLLIIIQSEVSQKEKQNHEHRDLTGGCQGLGGDWGRDGVGSWD